MMKSVIAGFMLLTGVGMGAALYTLSKLFAFDPGERYNILRFREDRLTIGYGLLQEAESLLAAISVIFRSLRQTVIGAAEYPLTAVCITNIRFGSRMSTSLIYRQKY